MRIGPQAGGALIQEGELRAMQFDVGFVNRLGIEIDISDIFSRHQTLQCNGKGITLGFGVILPIQILAGPPMHCLNLREPLDEGFFLRDLGVVRHITALRRLLLDWYKLSTLWRACIGWACLSHASSKCKAQLLKRSQSKTEPSAIELVFRESQHSYYEILAWNDQRPTMMADGAA